MAGAGGQDEHVARTDLEALAARPAEQHARAPGDDPEDLVRRGVEMVLVEDPAAPLPTPAVGAEQRLAVGGCVAASTP